MNMDLAPFKAAIKERCGLSFEDLRTAKLADCISTRMSELGIAAPEQYLACLSRELPEFDRLVSLLTVKETYFFREPEQLRLLADRLVPELLSKDSGKIRILSAGCATGEEPYSIVMTLMDIYGPQGIDFLAVTAVDIDHEAIGRAREGVYPANSFRTMGLQQKKRYFEEAGPGRYRIRQEVKNQVAFEQCNLLSDTYPECLKKSHIVFYRNVSIYFGSAVQKSIFRKLADLLVDDGCLIVSSTETLAHNIGVLTLTELDGIFMYRKNIGLFINDRRKSGAVPAVLNAQCAVTARSGKQEKAASPPAPLRGAVAAETASQTLRGPAESNSTRCRDKIHLMFDEALELARAKDYERALRDLEEILADSSSFLPALMLKAGILINMNMPEQAEEVCRRSLEIAPLELEPHLLLGLTAKIRSDEDTAVKRFREALYIQPSCWLAHFCLAELYALRQELAPARREYGIVVSLLEKGDIMDHGLTFFPLSFPAEQIVHLCRHNLSGLEGDS